MSAILLTISIVALLLMLKPLPGGSNPLVQSAYTMLLLAALLIGPGIYLKPGWPQGSKNG